MKKVLFATLLVVAAGSAHAQTRQFNSYVPRYDVNLYREIGMAKQRQYDDNVRSIKESVEQTNDLFERTQLESSVREGLQEAYNKLLAQMNQRIDWGESQNYNWAMDRLSGMRRTIRKYEL